MTIILTNLERHDVKTLPLSEAKSTLSGLVERVRTHDEEVVITKNGRPAAVLVSPEEFESWKETVAIRADPAFMKEIRKGLAALKARKARIYTLDELLR
ncbi:MAG: type II toxin-antitoxin system Phd/YefM family antitoxin [Burkholderiales bacterium]